MTKADRVPPTSHPGTWLNIISEEGNRNIPDSNPISLPCLWFLLCLISIMLFSLHMVTVIIIMISCGDTLLIDDNAFFLLS